MNHSSHTINEVLVPFIRQDDEENAHQSHEPSAGVKWAININTFARSMGSGAGKIHNALLFKKKGIDENINTSKLKIKIRRLIF